jgi:bacterioferritin-associated ferredoxin
MQVQPEKREHSFKAASQQRTQGSAVQVRPSEQVTFRPVGTHCTCCGATSAAALSEHSNDRMSTVSVVFRHQSGTAWEPEALSRIESLHSVATATGMQASKCMPCDSTMETSDSDMSPKQKVFCSSVGAGIVVSGHRNCTDVNNVAYKLGHTT